MTWLGRGNLSLPAHPLPTATPEAGSGPDVFYNLQAMRGYAAISVATFHFALIPASAVSWHYGSFGVDLFFVLSGFIIAWSTRAGHPGFLMHRLVRVLPSYWIATGLIGLLVLLAMPADAALGWIGRSLLFLHGPDGRPPLLFVGWTLVYEMVFYFLYSVALHAGPRRAPIVAIAALMVLAYGGRLSGLAVRDWPLLVEFAFGLAIFLWVNRYTETFHPAVATSLVITGVALLYVFEPGLHGQDGAAADQVRVAALGLPAAAIVFGLVQLERAGIAIRSRFVLALGAASYALYLLHPVIFSFVLPFPPGSLERRYIVFMLLLTSTVAVSLGFRSWIEVPMLRSIHRWMTGTAARPVDAKDQAASIKDPA